MILFKKLKLAYRAYKYMLKDDPGGIEYLNSIIKEGQTVLDIGCHKGGYLYFIVNRVGKTGKVHAFEPQLNLYRYLISIKKIFDWNQVVLNHLALSDKKGEVTLYIPSNKTSKSSSPGATIVAQKCNKNFLHTEKGSTETLDSYTQRNQLEPDFLKIDVEGNELRIFEGGIQTLKKYKPKILVEIESRHVGEEQVKETFQILESIGYNGHFIHNKRIIPISEFNISTYQNRQDMANYCNNFIFE